MLRRCMQSDRPHAARSDGDCCVRVQALCMRQIHQPFGEGNSGFASLFPFDPRSGHPILTTGSILRHADPLPRASERREPSQEPFSLHRLRSNRRGSDLTPSPHPPYLSRSLSLSALSLSLTLSTPPKKTPCRGFSSPPPPRFKKNGWVWGLRERLGRTQPEGKNQRQAEACRNGKNERP